MKNLISLIVLSVSFSASSQQIYGEVSTGYLYNPEVVMQPYYMVNTYHTISMPWFLKPENYSFQNNFHFDFNLGHLVNKNIGYELSASYLKPANVSGSDEYTERTLAANFVQTSAKFVLVVPFEKVSVYAKLGVSIATGKMRYHQKFVNDPVDPALSFSEATITYQYTDGLSWGFNSAFGVNVPVSKRFSLNAELNIINQVFAPKIGKALEHSVDGEDQLSTDAGETRNSEITYGDKADLYYYDWRGDNRPQEMYKHAYQIGGYGLSLGVKYIIWQKKRGWTR